MELVRNNRLCKKALIVDGLPGCGKTMMASVMNSLQRVEMFQYAYEIEIYCFLNYLKKIDYNTAVSIINHKLDLTIYNTMMSREFNFRYNDLSSAFKSIDKFKYFKRLFSKGDEVIPSKINLESPILHLATHCLSAFASPLLNKSNKEILLINFHRNPLYMIRQNSWNMKNLTGSKRHFNLYYNWKGTGYPLFFKDQEEVMIKSNSKERAILSLKWYREKYLENNNSFDKNNYIKITFESFVNDPSLHIDLICEKLKTKRGKKHNKILKKEKIPRKILSHGRDLQIYRRVNWVKTKATSPEKELEELYKWVTNGLSIESKKALEWLMEDYNSFKNSIDD